jgi:integrase
LAYARERQAALQVFLTDPDVPMDTNHLERALRAIPMGRRNAKSAVMRSRVMRGWRKARSSWSAAHLRGSGQVIGSPARWHLAPLPRTLSRADVERLLGAFPPGLPSRLRSYAIVRCIVDLGLRTREVSSLSLEDIDWAAGTLRIAKGKCPSRDLI